MVPHGRWHIWQGLFVACFLAWSWLAMQGVHELGHVVGALTSGGHVHRVIWHPTTISRTDVTNSTSPLWVVWAGPLLGTALPTIATALLSRVRGVWSWSGRAFAGFCLIANGAYLAAGAVEKIGDAAELLRDGCPPLVIWLFGITATGGGLFCWHTLGPGFGLRSPWWHQRSVSAVVGMGSLLIATLALQGLLSGTE